MSLREHNEEGKKRQGKIDEYPLFHLFIFWVIKKLFFQKHFNLDLAFVRLKTANLRTN